MYIPRHRKNLKPCLSFLRHDSKVLKNSVRKLCLSKRIEILCKLLFHTLPHYKMSSIRECITETASTTPTKLPRLSNPWELDIGPFPDHIILQLRSLKRAIVKKHSNMEPLNWQAGLRPNRPFEPLQNNLFLLPPRPAPPPPPRPCRQKQIPTQYYLEQAPFYAENFGPDPYAYEPEVIQPGLLRIFVINFATIFAEVTIPGFNILASLVSRLSLIRHFMASWSLRVPVKKICGWARSVKWEAAVALALATQVVKLLPGMDGEVLMDGGKGGGPIYTIFVAGRRAIGNGPVMPGSF